VVSSLLAIYFADWTPTLFATCNETLFREVCHINGEDWEDMADFTVCAHHLTTSLSLFHERFEHSAHAVMEEPVFHH
jgi:hypothetical protein